MFRWWWSPNRNFWYSLGGALFSIPMLLIVCLLFIVFSPSVHETDRRIHEVKDRIEVWEPEYTFSDVSKLYNENNKFEQCEKYEDKVIEVSGTVRVMARDDYFRSMDIANKRAMEGSVYIDSVLKKDLYIVCDFEGTDKDMAYLLDHYKEGDDVTVVGEMKWVGTGFQLVEANIKHK